MYPALFLLLRMPQWTLQKMPSWGFCPSIQCASNTCMRYLVTNNHSFWGWGMVWRIKREAGHEKKMPWFSSLCLSELGWSYKRPYNWNCLKKFSWMGKKNKKTLFLWAAGWKVWGFVVVENTGHSHQAIQNILVSQGCAQAGSRYWSNFFFLNLK